MKRPDKTKYIYTMLAGFGSISLSVLLFFLLYKLEVVRFGIGTLTSILAPFIYGGIIAYLLCPVCNRIDRFLIRKFPKLSKRLINGISVSLASIFGLLIMYALIMMIVPQFIENIISMWNALPEKVDNALAWLRKDSRNSSEIFSFFDQAGDWLYTAINDWVEENILNNITNIVSSMGAWVWSVVIVIKNILIGLIVSVYFMLNRKKFGHQGTLIIRSIFKPTWADVILSEIHLADGMFGGFITGKLLDSGIIGVLCYLGCLIFRFPNALLISVIVGVTNIIPVFGPIIGAIPSAFLILLENPIKALWFSVFILALQQLDGHVIGPAILGNKTGLSSFWVLFSIVLFGGLWGIAGMVIGVPLFAVIYDIIKKLVNIGLRRNGVNQEEDEEKMV